MIEYISNYLSKKFIKDYQKVTDQNVRAQYGILEGWLSIVVNLLLAILKFTLSFLYGSISLFADAIHSLSDMATSLVIIIGFKISQKPSDSKHPFGHGRFEQIATLVIAVMLMVIGFELAKYGFEKILEPTPLSMGWLPLSFIILTILIKEGIGQISKHLGEKIDSLTLEADFWHHRTDAISSLLVLIAIISSNFGFYYLDGIVGMLIGLFVIYIGWNFTRKSGDQLLGTTPNPKIFHEVEEIALQNPGVSAIHGLRVHEYGFQKIVSLHIEVPYEMTLAEAHTLSEKIESQIHENLNIDATIHVDPVLPISVENEKLEKLVREVVSKDERIEHVFDFRIVGEGMYSTLLFSLRLKNDIEETKIEDIQKQIQQQILLIAPYIKNIRINIVLTTD